MTDLRRLVVAITGASGAIYGVRLLEVLATKPNIETHLILTSAGLVTLSEETDVSPTDLCELAEVVHPERDIGASIASGSFRVSAMVVVPCSIKTLSAIASAYCDNLVSRAADVTLKERRRLVLVVRETPLHGGHLRLMSEVTAMGAVVFPPVPAFYHHPRSVADVVDQTVARILDLVDVEAEPFARWSGSSQAALPTMPLDRD